MALCQTTQSGVTVVCGRFPGISCQASWDAGRSWSLFTVDLSSAWAQGSLIEVEPDVILVSRSVDLPFLLLTACRVQWFYGSRGPGAGSGPYMLRSQRMRVEHSPRQLRAEVPNDR